MTHLGHILGALAGTIAISIAIYLQFVARGRLDWRYIAAFFILGAVTLLANLEFFIPNHNLAAGIMALGYSLLIVAEIAAGYWVYKRANVESPMDELRSTIRGHTKHGPR